MWSVVTLSPSTAIAFAPLISSNPSGGSAGMFSKYGGCFT
jgi:hypothetical protein